MKKLSKGVLFENEKDFLLCGLKIVKTLAFSAFSCYNMKKRTLSKSTPFENREDSILKKHFVRVASLILCVLFVVPLCACGSSNTSHTHDYNKEIVDATCLADGQVTYICKGCDYSFTERRAKTSHSIDSTGKCTGCEKQFFRLSNSLPATFSYTWGTKPDNIYTKLHVTGVSFSFWGSTLKVTINGKKTYDWKGDVGTTRAEILVVLKDSKGNVIGSEKVRNWNELVIGQAFQESAEFSKLSLGETYTVELRDCSI